ncbi:tripartite tricarboxylate transporter permease [Halomonas sp. TRM85114]|uniref:tripartite tricarboxylate transporter permease n=1 Tax=Halomonas jincaotanensis TaxID=2810616 RepID=UPI001BD48AF6|nr:tripartite tricarboxylate transporter permease [Halomonas jincaotanensis]MBS9404920.1 tripartite tricarboxylate transporter permease [Halomonas jincaotanensis]
MGADLLAGLAIVAEPSVLLTIIASAMFGFVVGALPGLTATMAVALLVPVTFLLHPVAAIASIVSASAMSIFAGDIPGALLRMPGTPASAAYMEEAYALTRKGEAGFVIATSATTAAIGGIFGTAALILASPALADMALQFSSFEFFWLGCLGLSCAVFVSGDDVPKGLIALLIGLLISTVGMDYGTAYPRFTFGSNELMDGVSFIPALIGMFALPEIVRSLSSTKTIDDVPQLGSKESWSKVRVALRKYWTGALRGSSLGTVIGALPGAGADIASWISFAVAKRFSKEPKKWGTGHIEGIVSAGASNNAALASAWIPALVFAIPGDTITAIAIGVLYMQGMNPGPTIFINNADMVYAVFIVFLIANLLLVPFGWAAMRVAGTILRIPQGLIAPTLLVMASIGAFAINNDMFGLLVMLALGVLAFLMNGAGLPLAPTVLGIVLGQIVEKNLIQSLISTQGDVFAFFERPLSAFLGVLTILVWTVPLVRFAYGRFRPKVR